MRRGRQHDISMPGGFREEDVLHHQMFELRQRSAGVDLVRIGHRGVLAHDEHRADAASEDRIHDLDDRQPALPIERAAPGILIGVMEVRSLDGFVIGIKHRDQPGIRGALHIILSAQGMQARSWPPGLASGKRQRDQAAGVVRAMNMLRNAHAPEDDRGLCLRVFPRDLANGRGVNAADWRHGFRREILHGGFKCSKPIDMGGDIGGIGQPLGHDDVEHGVEQRDIRAGLEAQRMRRMPHQARAARVDHDQRLAGLRCLLEIGRCHRVVLGRPGTDHDDAVALQRRRERGRDRARTDALHQRRDGGGMAKARAMVDIVGAKSLPNQLLEEISFFVRAFR